MNVKLVTGAIALAAATSVYSQVQAPAATATNPTGANVAGTGGPTDKPLLGFEGTDLHIGDLPPITFHGFASQGFLYSEKYNYLAESSEGSFLFSQFGLNASMNPLPRTRIALQGFSYDVGKTGEYDAVLDYALAEYTFCDEFGIRAGRVRRPEGIYNDIQDLDMTYTFALLPQGMYNARWRDMYTTCDGGEVFGNIGLGKGGSLSYEVYSGLQRPQLDGGLAEQKANQGPLFAPITSFNSPLISGFQLWWNTPLSGFRAGAALNYDNNLKFTMPFGANQQGVQLAGSPLVQHYSLEYVKNNWTFQAEYFTYLIHYQLEIPQIGLNEYLHIHPDSWYVGAAYRFNHWLEVGTYYTEYYPDVRYRDASSYVAANPGEPGSDCHQDDVALAFRFDPTPWWIIKLEGHMIEGTGQLYDDKANPVRDNRWWPMLAIKTTFNF